MDQVKNCHPNMVHLKNHPPLQKNCSPEELSYQTNPIHKLTYLFLINNLSTYLSIVRVSLSQLQLYIDCFSEAEHLNKVSEDWKRERDIINIHRRGVEEVRGRIKWEGRREDFSYQYE